MAVQLSIQIQHLLKLNVVMPSAGAVSINSNTTFVKVKSKYGNKYHT